MSDSSSPTSPSVPSPPPYPSTSAPLSASPSSPSLPHSPSGSPPSSSLSSTFQNFFNKSPYSATSSSTPPSPSLLSSLSSNPLFFGGAGLASVGIALTGLRRVSASFTSLFKRFYTISLEIPSRDRSYPWILNYITKSTANSSQHFGIETSFHQHSNGSISTKFSYIPSTGLHFFVYKRRLIIVQRDREKQMVDFQSGAPWETVTLSTWGKDKGFFTSLLEESKQAAMKKNEGKTIIYHTMGVEWKQFGNPRPRRPLHSVLLDPGVSDFIVEDIKEFLQSQQWYMDRGIPYRRGYLLHGPPGCGKSSFIFSLAGELEYNIGIINLNERGLTDDKLHYCLTNLPPKTIVLLEDIDAAFRSGGGDEDTKREGREYVGITFSGLLNALDGVSSTEERIVIMTTNHLHRLDPALIRPGRVDIEQYIGYATQQQLNDMWCRFFPAHQQEAKTFVDGLQGRPLLSMAEVQGFFLLFKDDVEGALRYYTLLKIPKEERNWDQVIKKEHEKRKEKEKTKRMLNATNTSNTQQSQQQEK